MHNEIKEKIYQSYFIEGLDIGNKEILINIGKKFNINADTINDFFNIENIKKINSYISVAREKVINGVPFFEIGKDFISGASKLFKFKKYNKIQFKIKKLGQFDLI